MTFDLIPANTEIFLDANTAIYHFTNHAKYGAACTQLLERIERQELQAHLSSHVLADVAHRLMTIEAMNNLSWPITGLAARLKKHHREIPKLGAYRQALSNLDQIGVQVIPMTKSLLFAAAVIS